MELVTKIMDMFKGRKGLDRITADELRRERIRLEQVEQRIAKEVEEVEQRKRELFARGKDEPSQRQQVSLARKIKELDVSCQTKDRQLAMISRQLRVLTGFRAIKENEQLVRELGVSSIISRMDLEALQKFVDRATVEGQFQMERFAAILKTMESAEGDQLGAAEDADTLAIVAAMQEAKSAESDDPETALRAGMTKLDRILRPAKEDGAEEGPPA